MASAFEGWGRVWSVFRVVVVFSQPFYWCRTCAAVEGRRFVHGRVGWLDQFVFRLARVRLGASEVQEYVREAARNGVKALLAQKRTGCYAAGAAVGGKRRDRPMSLDAKGWVTRTWGCARVIGAESLYGAS